MTRSEQEMYKNIERIAVALETIVIQGKDQKLNQFKKAANLIYGNDQMNGRSADNYNYPSKGTSNIQAKDMYQGIHTPADVPTFQHPTDIPTNRSTNSTSLSGFNPIIESDIDQRIYDQSQKIKAGDFSAWYKHLTSEEQSSWKNVYRNAPDNSPVSNKYRPE